MSVYKDTKQGTWYATFRYVDWTGEKKQKLKRGFRTKKEAQEYEIEYKRKAVADMDMDLGTFVEIYFEDKKYELKHNSVKKKRHMIRTHILPYFGDRKMNEILPADIIKWQNVIQEKGLSKTYERMVQNQITALFNHAQRIYNLQNNPCKKVRKMGKSDADKMNFWTLDEYEQFLSVIDPDSDLYLMAELLFWTGMREGELLALTPADVDLKHREIHINKTYYRSEGRDIITTPKTDTSNRTIIISDFLAREIERYFDFFFSYPSDERLFPIVTRTLQKRMRQAMEKAGVKKIRIHDLRHSHVAYLINQGVQPLIIKERLGHKDIKITLNTYGHLYPSQQKEVAEMMNLQRRKQLER
jgi:integrase